MWYEWLTGFLGIWVVVLGFMGIVSSPYSWALVVTGLAISVLGFWGAWRDPEEPTEMDFLNPRRDVNAYFS